MKKMNKTRTMMTGIMTAALAVTSACGATQSEPSPQKEVSTTAKNSEDVNEKSLDNTKANSKTNQTGDKCEVELDNLASKYPNVDIDAIEDYLEKQGDNCNYDKKELEDFIADLNDNGQPTTTSSNHFGSSFPWWLWLLSNNGSSNHSSYHNGINNDRTPTYHSNLTNQKTTNSIKSGETSKSTTNKSVDLSKPDTKSTQTHSQSSTTTAPKTSTNSSSSSISTGTKKSSTSSSYSSSSSKSSSSGFGSGSRSYGG